ncbi:Ubiquitin-fold modifier-conjugating enzyme [Trema orientale]|uniref:Ubiquitin-fold modifier-conjugating enzyme n=1 Tax=Trema orientale TaxID=63057 RepID=A0A2P5F5W5_TREOI|nr:Ubiquitin-fold modifier-conjugating enzyme [Trema orientale]
MGQSGELEKEAESFKRFDVVSDDSDHYYASLPKPKKKGPTGTTAAVAGEFAGDGLIDGGIGVQKKIMQEWRILEKNLPETIYVRVYENRIDLLRAVIVGAAGTPYHDGLFFFDLAFPSDYPARPPMVQYRSHGMRLNPNLYANGRVCLSLLNTWSGKKAEKWNPAESTVLQVLVSIQALVLNEKPFFNEPGAGIFGHARWEKNSQAYNEDVFVLSCKTALFSLRNPPKNFEPFVAAHFRIRANAILAACGAYATGRVRVAYYYRDDGDGDDDAAASSSSSKVDASRRFKGSMEALYPQLVAAFKKNGASLGNFVEQLKLEKETTSCEAKTAEGNRGRNVIANKVIGRIKSILGLKKKNGTTGTVAAVSN